MKSNVFLGLLKSKGKNLDWLIEQIGEDGVQMSKSTFYKKLRGETQFVASEIKVISQKMNFSSDQMLDIFFDELVS